MYEGGGGQNRETFPHIPDEPMQQTAKLFTLETFIVYGSCQINEEYLMFFITVTITNTGHLLSAPCSNFTVDGQTFVFCFIVSCTESLRITWDINLN